MNLELALNALKRSKKFTFIFIFNFSLAIFGIFSLQYFKGTMEKSLGSKAKVLLGSDLVVSSKFPIEKNQIDLINKSIPATSKTFKGVSMMSMVSSKVRSRLTQVAQVEKGFPFYGGFEFSDKSKFKSKLGSSAPSENEIWVYPEILKHHKASIGDKLKIGEKFFEVTKVVTEDSFKSLRFSGFVPRIYMSIEGIKRAKILQFGSTVEYTSHFQFKDNFSNKELEEIEESLEEKLGKAVRVRSPNDGGDRIVRVMEYVINFLSLVSLVSFFLGLVGLFYLYSGYLEKSKKDMKVMIDLGIRKFEVVKIYLIHFLIMLLLSCCFVFMMLSFASPIMKNIISSNIPIMVDYSIDLTFFLKALALVVSLALSLGLPMITASIDRKSRRIIQYVPLIIILLGLSHFVASFKFIGLSFSFAVFIIVGCVFILGRFLLSFIDRSGLNQSLNLSLALKNLIRRKDSTLTIFTALFLSTALFSLIPQVGSSLSKALSLTENKRPRFFVLDGDESQTKDLDREVSKLGGVLENISPMVRARIVKVNGEDFRGYNQNDDISNSELQNRVVNLSYRQGLKNSEKIVEGRDFSGTYTSKNLEKPVEVSLESGYAFRRGLKLNDKITFDVLGLELQGVIVNLRSVDWAEFVPNFFFIMQDGAINDAPKTILATIRSGDYDADNMLLELSSKFPGLTIFDVKNVIEEFSKIVSTITNILNKMSLFSVLIGLLMTFIIIIHQMGIRRGDILRLKMIGLKISNIRKSLLYEFTILSLLSVSLGLIVALLGSYLVSSILFEGYWDVQLPIILSFLFIVPALILLVVSYSSYKVTREKENNLFGEN